jgi:hypothetical protein
MRPFEMPAGDAIADGKIRAAAAEGEAGEQIGGKLIIEPPAKPPVFSERLALPMPASPSSFAVPSKPVSQARQRG